jgi:hypothetical protein
VTAYQVLEERLATMLSSKELMSSLVEPETLAKWKPNPSHLSLSKVTRYQVPSPAIDHHHDSGIHEVQPSNKQGSSRFGFPGLALGCQV